MEETAKRPKPSFAEVLAYAKPIVHKTIAEKYPNIPREHKEEIHQNANMRLWAAYADLDPEKGWKSFTYTHAKGAVLDYQKSGTGFEEDSWSLNEEEEHGAMHVNKIRHRLEARTSEGDEVDLDVLLAMNGRFHNHSAGKIRIHWAQLARMASVDEPLHVFCRVLRGQRLEEIAEHWGQSRTRVGQLVQEFIYRFDDPKLSIDPWLDQTIWALGLAEAFGIKDCNQELIHVGVPLGRSLTPVDFEDLSPAPKRATQMGLFA
jgi:RNA polymerase sigma factor (sigma-70 family)